MTVMTAGRPKEAHRSRYPVGKPSTLLRPEKLSTRSGRLIDTARSELVVVEKHDCEQGLAALKG